MVGKKIEQAIVPTVRQRKAEVVPYMVFVNNGENRVMIQAKANIG